MSSRRDPTAKRTAVEQPGQGRRVPFAPVDTFDLAWTVVTRRGAVGPIAARSGRLAALGGEAAFRRVRRAVAEAVAAAPYRPARPLAGIGATGMHAVVRAMVEHEPAPTPVRRGDVVLLSVAEGEGRPPHAAGAYALRRELHPHMKAHRQHPRGFLRLGPSIALRTDNEGRIAKVKPLSRVTDFRAGRGVFAHDNPAAINARQTTSARGCREVTTSRKPWRQPDVTPAPRTGFAQVVDSTKDRTGEQPRLGRYRKNPRGCCRWAICAFRTDMGDMGCSPQACMRGEVADRRDRAQSAHGA